MSEQSPKAVADLELVSSSSNAQAAAELSAPHQEQVPARSAVLQAPPTYREDSAKDLAAEKLRGSPDSYYQNDLTGTYILASGYELQDNGGLVARKVTKAALDHLEAPDILEKLSSKDLTQAMVANELWVAGQIARQALDLLPQGEASLTIIKLVTIGGQQFAGILNIGTNQVLMCPEPRLTPPDQAKIDKLQAEHPGKPHVSHQLFDDQVEGTAPRNGVAGQANSARKYYTSQDEIKLVPVQKDDRLILVTRSIIGRNEEESMQDEAFKAALAEPEASAAVRALVNASRQVAFKTALAVDILANHNSALTPIKENIPAERVGLLGGKFLEIFPLAGSSHLFAKDRTGEKLVAVEWNEVATEYGYPLGQPADGELPPKEIIHKVKQTVSPEVVVNEIVRKVRQFNSLADQNPVEQDPYEAVLKVATVPEMHPQQKSAATQSTATPEPSKPILYAIPSLAGADQSPQNTSAANANPALILTPNAQASLAQAIIPTPRNTQPLQFNQSATPTETLRESLVSELTEARDSWLQLAAERSRRTFTFGEQYGGRHDDPINQAREKYESKRDALWHFEAERLSSMDFSDVPVTKFGNTFELHDVLAAAKVAEKRMLAYRLADLSLKASGNHRLTVDADDILRVEEVQRQGMLAKRHNIYKWFGDTSGTVKERGLRALGKTAIIAGSGLTVTAAVAAAGTVLPISLGAAGVIFGVTRVSRAFAVAGVNSKAKNANAEVHAQVTRSKILNANTDGNYAMPQRQGILRRKPTEITMEQAINRQVNREVLHNRIRLGVVATAATVSATVGPRVAEYVLSHNPLHMPHLPHLGSHHDPTQGQGKLVQHQTPTGTAGPQPTPTHTPVPNSGNGHGQPNGNGQHGHTHPQYHQPQRASTFELKHSGDTVWGSTVEYANQHGVQLTNAQTRQDVGKILRQNHQTWASARQLPVGYQWHVNQYLLHHLAEEKAAA